MHTADRVYKLIKRVLLAVAQSRSLHATTSQSGVHGGNKSWTRVKEEENKEQKQQQQEQEEISVTGVHTIEDCVYAVS